MPSIDQLFNTASGNVSLRAEHAYGVELGGDYQLTTTSSLGVATFSTDAHDFIERVSGSPFENQDRYRFRGLEVSGHTHRIPGLDLRAAYSFLHAEAVLPAGTRLLQTRPRHRSSLEWSWAPAPGSVFRGAASHTGNQRYDARGSDAVQLLRRGHTLVDLGFTQTVARHYDVALDVTNLLDRLYDQAYGLPREGRAAVLTLRARFD
jgi:outer membrane cobalamin receptor